MVVDIGYDVWFFLLKSHNACVDVSTFRCPLISSVFVRTVFEAAAATSFLLPCRSLFARARALALERTLFILTRELQLLVLT